ncbi:DUF6287 domain-containing protein [Streptococcus sp. sy018]|uniref:DUF6287 domain-containing protein n=1 Tax=Streptococcus sp. sy018 TaxID=2600147 RepID=UPI0011B845EE|nr:DUF6287 domain-containing protein [Streptococcus sp. sy018]TWS94930.1 hypothetical protein FRX52_03130 [Streptococcus sp. sy018]
MKKYLTLFSLLLLTACSVKESKESTTTIIETANGSSSQSSTSQNASSSSSSAGESSSTVAKESSSSSQSESSSSADKKANTSSQSSSNSDSSSSSQTESSDSSSTVAVDYSLYDSVISEYRQVVDGNNPTSSISAESLQLRRGISYYTDIEYNLYDFDQNGVDELTVSLIAKDGYRALLDIFTIKDNQAIRLTNDSNLAMLGNRMRLIPLQDGSFYYKGSGSASSAVYAHYRLTADGGALEKVTESMSESDLGKLPEALDLTTLTWQSVQNSDSQTSSSQTETVASSSMDLQAIMAGDYSSIAGTWKNGKADSPTYTFTSSSIQATYPDGRVETRFLTFNESYASSTIAEKGYLTGTFNEDSRLSFNSAAGLCFLPVGSTVSEGSDVDASDGSKERIWFVGTGMNPSVVMADLDTFYYKVSD